MEFFLKAGALTHFIPAANRNRHQIPRGICDDAIQPNKSRGDIEYNITPRKFVYFILRKKGFRIALSINRRNVPENT